MRTLLIAATMVLSAPAQINGGGTDPYGTITEQESQDDYTAQTDASLERKIARGRLDNEALALGELPLSALRSRLRTALADKLEAEKQIAAYRSSMAYKREHYLSLDEDDQLLYGVGGLGLLVVVGVAGFFIGRKTAKS